VILEAKSSHKNASSQSGGRQSQIWKYEGEGNCGYTPSYWWKWTDGPFIFFLPILSPLYMPLLRGRNYEGGSLDFGLGLFLIVLCLVLTSLLRI
jgi:hypothetical protein